MWDNRPMKTCKVDGCNNKINAKGLCNAHYLREYRHGRLQIIVDKSGLAKKYPKEHNTYRAIKNRCLCPTDRNYPRWGGRGIKICDRWLEKPNGFRNFIDDMGPRPENTTLDRIDNSKGYSPDNCRWATPWEQVANSSRLAGRIPGVYFIKAKNKWCANFKKGEIRLTKSCETKEDAIAQRKVWEQEYLACTDDKNSVIKDE